MKIDATTVQDPREQREQREQQHQGKGQFDCFCCGRGITHKAAEAGWWVHIEAAHYDLVPVGHVFDDATEEDQGWFPVGRECAKRIPLTHRARIAA